MLCSLVCDHLVPWSSCHVTRSTFCVIKYDIILNWGNTSSVSLSNYYSFVIYFSFRLLYKHLAFFLYGYINICYFSGRSKHHIYNVGILLWSTRSNMGNLFLIALWPLKWTSKLSMRCIDNIVIFYVRWFWRMLYMYYSKIVIELY